MNYSAPKIAIVDFGLGNGYFGARENNHCAGTLATLEHLTVIYNYLSLGVASDTSMKRVANCAA